MWTLTERQKFVGLLPFVIVALLFGAHPLQAQYVTATLPAGTNPYAAAVNEVTNKIYVANRGSNNVTVIDGPTNSTTTVEAGTYGSYPRAVAVNPVTNKIYVANISSNNVTVIDGATNSTATVADPNAIGPFAVAVNPVTNKIYVANNDSANVTVIDGATNSITTVGVGSNPDAVAVNPVTNKIYVANEGGNVTVIDGATNSITTVTDPNATAPWAVAVNPVTNQIYVANYTSNNVTVIDGVTNSTTTVTDPNAKNPWAIALNPVTNKIYVANENSNNVTVIDGAKNSTTTVGVGAPANPTAVAVNPVTNTIYVGLCPFTGGTCVAAHSGDVLVIDGTTNSTTVVGAGFDPVAVAVNPVTDKIYTADYFGPGAGAVTVIDGATLTLQTAPVGLNPVGVAVNAATNLIYAANYGDNTVSIIDGETGFAETAAAAGSGPYAVAVNPATDKIYVANQNSANVTVIDGATNSTTTVEVGTYPYAVAVNPVTNKIYVPNEGSANVTVIDGATNSTITVGAGSTPYALAVNTVTNMIYVANYESNNVTVVNGATNLTTTVTDTNAKYPCAVAVNPVTNQIYVANCGSNNVTVIDGAANSTTTVAVGSLPESVAVNPVTNMIYVGNFGSPYITVINGANNSTTTVATVGGPWIVAVNPVTDKIYAGTYNSDTVTEIDGATNTPTTLADTSVTFPWAIAVNPITNRVYVTEEGSNNILEIIEQQVQPNPLVTAITPFTNNEALVGELTLEFTATSSFSPTAPTPQQVWYQFDTWEGPWLATSGAAPNFSVTTTTSGLPEGTHILYAFATDGQDGNSTGMAQQLVGTMAAYLFTVVPFNTTTTLTSDPNPSEQGNWVQFTAAVTENSPGSAIPTGTVTFLDGSTSLGTAPLGSNGQATFFTQTLSAGSHTITANYNGDVNDFGSTSGALTQQVNGLPVTITPSSLVFGNQAAGTTSASQPVTLLNTSGQTLSITSIEATADFLQTNNCGLSVAVGASCTINVSFAPLGTGPLYGALLISDNATGSPQAVYLSGTGTSTAILTATPTSLSFGNQATNETSAAKTVTLTNTGTASVTISSITASADFAVSSTTCGATLAAGAKCTVGVTFTPPALGAVTGALTFNDNAANNPQAVPLSGTGVTPATLTPTTATYASQAEGTTSAAKTFTLTNNQTVALTGIAISTTGDFAVSATTCTTSLAVKGKCTISVTFTPDATGTLTGQLSVSDSATNSPQTANLTGTGVVPATLTPTSATYAAQKVGTTSAAKTFTLTNNQSVPLTGIAISTYAPYAVSATTCTTSLAAKAKCTISVTFTPETAESWEAALFVYDSASNSPQTSIMLGTGK
jgi:YVTN family beta-propeller protein